MYPSFASVLLVVATLWVGAGAFWMGDIARKTIRDAAPDGF